MSNKQIEKLIVVILDGCRYDAAVDQLGFLNHLVEHKQGIFRQVQSEMPSNSRPLYEVLMTGVPTYQNQIHTNFSSVRSNQVSLFDLVKQNNGHTGAAAYHWYSELYNQAPYNFKMDRIQNQPDKGIQHGIFYSEDTYPDSHLFADAQYIIDQYAPEFMLVHSMNIDDVGHKFTAASKEYQSAVNLADILLGIFLPEWLKKGYQVVVTADHGMDEYGLHGGSRSAHREVPFYLFSSKQEKIKNITIKQLELAPLFCFLLGIEPATAMLDIAHLLEE